MQTVLYVDDNVANLRLVERTLALRPAIQVLTAMHGRRALELAREHLPHLILLDVHLPDISGDEVLRCLRSDVKTSSIPVVMVSADATQPTRERFLTAGARDFLSKPIDVTRLLEFIDTISAAGTPLPGASTAPRNDHDEQPNESEPLNDRALGLLRRAHDAGPRGEAGELIGLFIRESAQCLTDLRDAVSRSDSGAAVRLAHSLNGLAGSYGSRLLPDKCRLLEQLAASGDMTSGSKLLEVIEWELERMHAALRARFPDDD